ncbi:MAG: DNA primase family protein [Alphaproteobacteria bacterium]
MLKEDYQTVYNITLSLSKMSSHEELQSVLANIAKLEPKAYEEDKLLRSIAKQAASSVTVIRQEYVMMLKKLNMAPNDVGFNVAQETLNNFYGQSGLKRYPDGSFYVYDQTHWRITTQDQVRSNIQQIAVNYSADTKKTIKALVGDAFGCLCDYLGTDEDALDFTKNPDPVINFKNGELWIKESGEIEMCPHKPESRLFYCLPFNYDPEAKAPKYEQALLDIFSEAKEPAEVISHWHEFFGYTIQPRRFTACFFMLIGHGRNGKTVLLKTIQNVLGRGTVLNDSLSTFQGDRFNAAALRGKLLFIDDDLDSKVTLSDGLLKKISEAKMMSARRAHGKTKLDFMCLALPVMAGNHYPGCDDMSEGMTRRVNVFPFNRQFTKEEADPKLFEYIWANEMPGVFNLALEGFRRVLKRDRFDPPEDCLDAKDEFLMHSNPTWCFITECLEPDDKGRIKLKDFRVCFDTWAKDQGFSKKPVLDKTLKRKLEGLGFEIVKNNGVNTIKGWNINQKNVAV